MPAWMQGQVVENRQWNTKLYSLKIKIESLQFKAGQFVLIGLDINGTLAHRPYSLVNTPQDSLLEIHFNTVTDGCVSHKLACLKIGDITPSI